MNTGGRKVFRAKQPDKGSFPLDHDGEYELFVEKQSQPNNMKIHVYTSLTGGSFFRGNIIESSNESSKGRVFFFI